MVSSATLQPEGADGSWAAAKPRPTRWWVHGPALIGLSGAGALLAIVLAHAPAKGLVSGLAACLLLPLMLWMRGDRLITTSLALMLGLSVPIHLRVNLLVENHVGAAPSITITLTVLLVALFWVVWLHRWLTGRIDTLTQWHRPTALALLLLMLLVLPSYGAAQYTKLFWLEWVRLLMLAAGAAAMMSLRDERLVRVFIFGVSIQAVVQAGVAVGQYALKRQLGLGILGEEAPVLQNIGITTAFRATGTLGHPNALAYFFEMLMPVLLGLSLTRQQTRWRLWYGFAFVCSLAGIFVTLTRGAWLTLPVSSLIVLWLVYGRRIVRAKALLMAAIVALATVAAGFYAWPIIEKRFTHTDYKSSGSRMPLNLASLSVIQKYPLAGVGLNNFAERFKVEDTTGHSRLFLNYKHLVHNMYLWIATEVGLIGLLGYMGVFFTTIVTAFKVAPRAPPIARALLVGTAAGLLAHLQHGFFDPGYRVSVPNSYQIYFSVGLVGLLALKHGHKRPRWFARRSA